LIGYSPNSRSQRPNFYQNPLTNAILISRQALRGYNSPTI